MSNLGRTLAQALDPDVVAQRIVDSLRALLNVRSASLLRAEAESGDLVALAVSGDAREALEGSARFTEGTGVVALAVRHRCPSGDANLLADPRVTLEPQMRSAPRAVCRIAPCWPFRSS